MGGGPSFYSIRQFLLKLTGDLYEPRKNYPSLYGGGGAKLLYPHILSRISSKQCEQEFLVDKDFNWQEFEGTTFFRQKRDSVGSFFTASPSPILMPN